MKDTNCSKFLKLSLLATTTLIALAIIVALSLSVVLSSWSLVYGVLIPIPTTILMVILSWYIPNLTISCGKKKISKKSVFFFVSILHATKYMLFIATILIGQLINVFVVNDSLFNFWTMLSILLIYPLTIGIIKFCFIKYGKEKEEVNRLQTIKF